MATYEPRTYRQRVGVPGLVAFRALVGETDLHIQASVGDSESPRDAVRALKPTALAAVREARRIVESEIALCPEFQTSLAPLDARAGASDIVSRMYAAGQAAGVGPMAAVAGAVAEFVGHSLHDRSPELIVENGGDIYLRSPKKRTVAIYAGDSPLSYRLGIQIPPNEGLGICTSAGTVGHSFSQGKADAAIAISDDTALADAVATALGNRVKQARHIQDAVDWASSVHGIRQALVILGADMGVWGEFELRGIDKPE